MTSPKVMVAQVWGGTEVESYARLSRQNVSEFCALVGYEYKFFHYPEFDRKEYPTPHWLKFKLLEEFTNSECDRLVFLDCDILLQPSFVDNYEKLLESEVSISPDMGHLIWRQNEGRDSLNEYVGETYYNTGVFSITRNAARMVVDFFKDTGPLDMGFWEQGFLNFIMRVVCLEINEIPIMMNWTGPHHEEIPVIHAAGKAKDVIMRHYKDGVFITEKVG